VDTIWDITRTLTGVKAKNEDIYQLNVNGDINYNFQTIPGILNNCFLPIMGKYHSALNKNSNNSVNYLHQTFNKPFSNIQHQYTSTKGTEKIISSLK
jgi:hypothetical protein